MKERSSLETFLFCWVCLIVFLTGLVVLVMIGANFGLLPVKANVSMTGTDSILLMLVLGTLFVSIWITLLLKMRKPTVKVLFGGVVVFALSTINIYYQGYGFSLIPVKAFSYSVSWPSGLRIELDITAFIISLRFLKAYFSRKNA